MDPLYLPTYNDSVPVPAWPHSLPPLMSTEQENVELKVTVGTLARYISDLEGQIGHLELMAGSLRDSVSQLKTRDQAMRLHIDELLRRISQLQPTPVVQVAPAPYTANQIIAQASMPGGDITAPHFNQELEGLIESQRRALQSQSLVPALNQVRRTFPL